MNIAELISRSAVSIDLVSDKKKEILSELLELLVTSGTIKKADEKDILKKLLEREALGSTGIGKGIAIPHAKCPNVKKMAVAFGISKKGMDFRSLDGELTHIFFLLLAPGDSPGPHLKALAKISRLLDDKFVRDRFLSAKNTQEVLKIIKEEEEKQPG